MKLSPTTITIMLCVGSGVTAFALQRVTSTSSRAESISRSFRPFAPGVKTRFDKSQFYVESNGMPDHPMMVGITAWQQQVPLPQDYTGRNAWQFPLEPTPAKNPMSAKDHFFRGAIAIAANGVPIFNPIKNDGVTDTFLAGELDKWGGHSGRGDDYHYHIGPTFLQEKLGRDLPIAYALDGYPLYGPLDPDGSRPKNLDSFNGHEIKSLGYHYHVTTSYPYINGGFHGEVVERDGQVDPQPRASSPRPATAPLRGAEITGFKTLKPGNYSLTYTRNGESRRVDYSVSAEGKTTFTFVDGYGKSETQTYMPRRAVGREDRPNDRQPNEPLGPPPGPRKPWLTDHFAELDTNSDNIVTLNEVTSQCKEAFRQYAQGSDSIAVSDLPNLPTARLAIGGFVKQHAKELDTNGDGKLVEKEITDSVMRMFNKQDRNQDGKLSREEADAPRELRQDLK